MKKTIFIKKIFAVTAIVALTTSFSSCEKENVLIDPQDNQEPETYRQELLDFMDKAEGFWLLDELWFVNYENGGEAWDIRFMRDGGYDENNEHYPHLMPNGNNLYINNMELELLPVDNEYDIISKHINIISGNVRPYNVDYNENSNKLVIYREHNTNNYYIEELTETKLHIIWIINDERHYHYLFSREN